MKDFNQWYEDPKVQDMLEIYGISKEGAEYVWAAAKISMIHNITAAIDS